MVLVVVLQKRLVLLLSLLQWGILPFITASTTTVVVIVTFVTDEDAVSGRYCSFCSCFDWLFHTSCCRQLYGIRWHVVTIVVVVAIASLEASCVVVMAPKP